MKFRFLFKFMIIVTGLLIVNLSCSEQYGLRPHKTKKISISNALNLTEAESIIYEISGKVIFQNTNGTFFVREKNRKKNGEYILVLFHSTLPDILGRDISAAGHIKFRMSNNNYFKSEYLKVN